MQQRKHFDRKEHSSLEQENEELKALVRTLDRDVPKGLVDSDAHAKMEQENEELKALVRTMGKEVEEARGTFGKKGKKEEGQRVLSAKTIG